MVVLVHRGVDVGGDDLDVVTASERMLIAGRMRACLSSTSGVRTSKTVEIARARAAQAHRVLQHYIQALRLQLFHIFRSPRVFESSGKLR